MDEIEISKTSRIELYFFHYHMFPFMYVVATVADAYYSLVVIFATDADGIHSGVCIFSSSRYNIHLVLLRIGRDVLLVLISAALHLRAP